MSRSYPNGAAAADPCRHQTHAASIDHGPAEYCENDAEPGQEHCLAHMDEADPDEQRDLVREWRDAPWHWTEDVSPERADYESYGPGDAA